MSDLAIPVRGLTLLTLIAALGACGAGPEQRDRAAPPGVGAVAPAPDDPRDAGSSARGSIGQRYSEYQDRPTVRVALAALDGEYGCLHDDSVAAGVRLTFGEIRVDVSEEGSGDASGLRIELRHAGGGWSGSYQHAAGEAQPPVALEDVTVDDRYAVSFALPTIAREPGTRARFRGVVGCEHLWGVMEGAWPYWDDQLLILPRSSAPVHGSTSPTPVTAGRRLRPGSGVSASR